MHALTRSDSYARTAPATPDRITIWPLDDQRFGVDVTYEGASGNAWTVRLTIPLEHVATVVARFTGAAS
jgi:hypothetical protein